MSKKIPLIALILVLASITIMALIAVASAYDGYYYPRHDTPKKTTYFSDKESYTNYYPWGEEKVTLTTKKKVETQDYYPNRQYSQPYYYNHPYNYDHYYKTSRYSPTFKYSKVTPHNWRYKEPYHPHNYPDSYNTYTTPYYYKPIYDSYLGHYNWRY